MVPVVSPTVCTTSNTAFFSDLLCSGGTHTSEPGQSHILLFPRGIHTFSQPGQSHDLLCPGGIHTSSQPGQSPVLPCQGGANNASKHDRMGSNSQEVVIQLGDLTEKDYWCSDCEKKALKEMPTLWFHYNLIKHTIQNKELNLNFHFQQFLYTTSSTDSEERSNVVYVDITNDPADSKETIFEVLTGLETEFREISGQSGFLVVVGDGKTYQHLTELKHAYSLCGARTGVAKRVQVLAFDSLCGAQIYAQIIKLLTFHG